MSDMDKVIRERLTEEKVRNSDVYEIVDWIHSLEDEIEQLNSDD